VPAVSAAGTRQVPGDQSRPRGGLGRLAEYAGVTVCDKTTGHEIAHYPGGLVGAGPGWVAIDDVDHQLDFERLAG